MTKKKPVNLNRYLKKNPFRDSVDLHKRFYWEYEQNIRLASMLVQREELAKIRAERRREKEAEQRRHLTRFLLAVGGQELLNQYNRSHSVGVTWELLGIARHPDYDKKYGKVREEEE